MSILSGDLILLQEKVKVETAIIATITSGILWQEGEVETPFWGELINMRYVFFYYVSNNIVHKKIQV